MTILKETKSGNVLAVDITDIAWYGTSADKHALADAFKGRMRVKKCSSLLVYVVPDFVFPMCENTKRHVVFSYTDPVACDETFKVDALFTCTIRAEEYISASEQIRMKLVRDARDVVNKKARGVAGKYVIQLSDGTNTTILERGRV